MTSTWFAVTNTDTPDAAEDARRERVLGAWSTAPFANLEVLSLILTVAREDVIEFAPAPGEEDDWDTAPKERYVLAQLEQAKTLWDAGSTDGGGEIGEGQFTFTPRPLDARIKRMIRPVDRKPHVL